MLLIYLFNKNVGGNTGGEKTLWEKDGWGKDLEEKRLARKRPRGQNLAVERPAGKTPVIGKIRASTERCAGL